MTTQHNAITLVELTADSGPLTIGSKAAGLVPLAHAGLPVPPAVVVPAEATEADIDSLAAEIADRFSDQLLAVRSSGAAEDLHEASFAGQYETVLNVAAQARPVADAIRTVRASARNAHVDTYVADRSHAMAVLIMPMIEAAAAGIAFTRDPITGADVVIVEAVAGLGHRLASGEQAGELWAVNDTVECRQSLGVLDADQVASIASVARRCEELAGCPQDIEWAISDGEIVLLQARPITTHDVEPIPMDDEVPPGPWEWDSTHNRIPITPLSISVFAPAFERGSRRLVEHYGIPLDHLAMRSINGYLYIQAVPPMGKASAPPPPAPIMRLLFKVIPALRRREQVAKKAFAERIDRQLVAEWRASIEPATERKLQRWYDLDAAALTDPELARELTDAAEEQRLTFSWNMATDPSYLIPLVALLEFVSERGLGGMEIVTRLLAGSARAAYRDSMATLADSVSPAIRTAIADGNGDVLDRLAAADAAFAAAYEAHRRAHGQRVLGFDLLDPTMLEDPGAELARLITLPEDVDPTPDAEALAAELRAGLNPEEAEQFDALVSEARATYPIREEGEALHARVMGAIRRLALEAGGRMVEDGYAADPSHACFLELEELVGWLDGRTDVSELIRLRRGQRQWAMGQVPPAALNGDSTMPDVDIFPPNVARVVGILNVVMAHDGRPSELPEGADGVAASPGIYTGPARIVSGPHDFGRVQPGDVLIAPITTSPWEVVFPHIGALVTEGGGLLSHPAIVAREYRLPAVVGCEGATTQFHDGQIVTVNGTNGTVRVVE
ncbi:MAG: PEP/pyruvate-binding domain-containing protein [Acidimicrobiia bacterium]|nr:PEP/pyruvate-binding domain-containing protein [Acidimicrobiia bacterium]